MYARQDNVSICLQAATVSGYGISVQGRVGPMETRGFKKGLDRDLDQASEPWVEQGVGLGAMAGAGL